MTSTVVIRQARTDDLPLIRSILDEAQLDTSDLAQHLSNFLVAIVDGRIVGTIGLENYGEVGLLRSAAVTKIYQGRGIGEKLVTTLVESARQESISRLILLTTTAQTYFAARGFIEIDRKDVDGASVSSQQFRGACPASAIVMKMEIVKEERTTRNGH